MSEAAADVGSILIPAHNEGSVIERSLAALLDGLRDGVDVVVVCNGCTDDTATVAGRFAPRVRVHSIEAASKVLALRAGDEMLHSFPRLYLDADVVLDGAAVGEMFDHLAAHPDVFAVRPTVRWELAGASRGVRSYYRARATLDAVHAELWGAGVYALSGTGRASFSEFPDFVADDLFVSQTIGRERMRILESVEVGVRVPTDLGNLLRISRRVYRGNHELQSETQAFESTTSSSVRSLARFARSGVRNAADAAVYVAVTVAARADRFRRRHQRWERDDSTR